MKRINFFLGAALTAFALTFTSCSTNDAPVTPEEPVTPPLVVDGDDLATAIEKSMEAGATEVTVNLPAGVQLTLAETIELNVPVTIVGDVEAPAVITATAGLVTNQAITLANVAINAADCAAPIITIAEGNAAEEIDLIELNNVTVTGLTQQLINGNKQKYLIDELNIVGSLIHVAGGSKTIIDFNGGGVPETTTIATSTIYANPQNTGALFSTQSGSRVTDFGEDKVQTLSIKNSTLYNIAYSKNVNSLRQNSQKWLTFEVIESIILDCGKEGQFIKGLNGGGQSPNPVYNVKDVTVFRTVDGAIEDQTAKENTNGAGTEIVGEDYAPVSISFADVENGDFTQSTLLTGDPRWTK